MNVPEKEIKATNINSILDKIRTRQKDLELYRQNSSQLTLAVSQQFLQNQEPSKHLKPPRQGHSNKKSDSNKGSRERLLVAGKSTKISSKDDDELDAFLLGDIS